MQRRAVEDTPCLEQQHAVTAAPSGLSVAEALVQHERARCLDKSSGIDCALDTRSASDADRLTQT